MKRGIDTFQTVKTEGSILPADLLRRLVDGDRDIPGLRPEDYHLARSERLNEASTRAWNRLQGAWEGFKDAMDALPESDAGTSLTREKWLLILFQELGYGRLTTRKAHEIEGKTYPVSHEWQNTPIHLVSFRQDLDKRTPGRAGAARVSPHSLVQEFLNRSDDHLWGFVSNGLNLRLLRDNVSLTRQAYVEFDLQAMMDSEAYSDFFLLYLLCHQSRVEVPEGKGPAHCWLEKWYNTAAQQGVRALEQLRDGVQRSIEALGGGFLACPGNTALREKLRSGALSTQDYYRQVLRQVYRLLFLFVAEDRELLSDPNSPPGTRKLYLDHYSTQRLRSLAGKTRGTRHPDLWRALRLVLEKLHRGCPQLALPALGSYLFSVEATRDLNDQDIANKDLLKAVRALAFTVDRNVLRPVNYRNLGPEELGSVYESLLEMHPTIHIEATNPEDRFRLTVAAGSERKTTGSYYTPTSLVNCLLDSALDPVLDEACKKPNPEKAVLALKVCDPACGSGHFLIAAAHRIAKRLAAIRSGEDEPAPEHYQHALRDVIGHCIYGVDINPMSVELCKVSLWMEAMEPGKPLAFLDHRIKCGNSLLGATPALLKKGIPDNAFKPIEGDDKEFCKDYRKRNKEERRGSRSLFAPDGMPWEQLGDLGPALMEIDSFDDSTLDGLQRKEEAYSQFVRSNGYLFGKLLYDAWCAAFVWKKRHSDELPYPITQEILDRIRRNPHSCPPWMREEIIRLAREYQFFHWHLEFPDVFKPKAGDEIAEDEVTGWSGGFDCVLGNPPWEKIQPEEQGFFAASRPDIAEATGSRRKRMIDDLAISDEYLYRNWLVYKRRIEGITSISKHAGRHPLSGRGRLNTYSLFLETAWYIATCSNGHVGLIVQTGLVTDDSNKELFRGLISTHSLRSLYDFENRDGLFPGVHREQRFCLVSLSLDERNDQPIRFAYWLTRVEHLVDEERFFSLTVNDLRLMSPNTGSSPTFHSRCEAEIVKWLYRHAGVLADERNPEWPIRPIQFINMTSDSGDFLDREKTKYMTHVLPVYEGKLTYSFDHRYATFSGGGTPQLRPVTLVEHQDPWFSVTPQYWMSAERFDSHASELQWDRNWFLTFHDIANPNNERTALFTVVPRTPVGNSAPLLTGNLSVPEVAFLLAGCNSLVVDFIVRRRIVSRHLNFFVLKQLAFPSRASVSKRHAEIAEPFDRWLISRVLELSFTGWDLQAFGRDCDYDGPPFRWDEERRFYIRCELDAAFFHIFLGSEKEWEKNGLPDLKAYFHIPRDAAEYVLDSFSLVKERDVQAHGRYRTKDTILEIYDEMAEVMRQNAAAVAAGRQPSARYQSRLDPLPGPPMDAEGNFIPMAQWDRANWPSHIHSLREGAITRPEEVPLEEFAAMAYPTTETDKAICAAALAVVEQCPGLSSMDHLDALLLATHPEWCKTFLDQEDQQAFSAVVNSAPSTLFVAEAQSIRWKECRDYLEQLQAISVRHGDKSQAIGLGAGSASVKSDLPGGVDEVVGYAIKVMKRIAELRKDLSTVPQDQLRIIQVFEEQHRLYQLAA